MSAGFCARHVLEDVFAKDFLGPELERQVLVLWEAQRAEQLQPTLREVDVHHRILRVQLGKRALSDHATAELDLPRLCTPRASVSQGDRPMHVCVRPRSRPQTARQGSRREAHHSAGSRRRDLCADVEQEPVAQIAEFKKRS